MLMGFVAVVDTLSWKDRREYRYLSLALQGDTSRCGQGVVRTLRQEKEEGGGYITTLHPSDLLDLDALVGKPVCGKRMVEQVEEQLGSTVVTCVDRPYEGAASLAQLVMVLEHGLLTWVMSPAPFAGDPIDDGDAGAPGPEPLYWPVPPTCHPLFAERPARKLTLPRHNMAVALEWMSDVDLLSLQAWQDDQETGYFVLLNTEGRPATIGYRVEGLAHGVWYYLNPDGSLREARLYALDVLLEKLPVATLPGP